MSEKHEKFKADAASHAERRDLTPIKWKHRKLPVVLRNIAMVFVGFAALAIAASVVLYRPIKYGDAIENFGIVLVMTAPVIAAVAFRVLLDSWLDGD